MGTEWFVHPYPSLHFYVENCVLITIKYSKAPRCKLETSGISSAMQHKAGPPQMGTGTLYQVLLMKQ
jgi:hypothetical protein